MAITNTTAISSVGGYLTTTSGFTSWQEQEDISVKSIIMEDLETGAKYKIVIRNGEVILEGTDTQTSREVKLKGIFNE